MFKPTLSLVAAATLVASLGADTLNLTPIVITSNLFDQDELNAPYSTEVYTAEDIAKSHAKTIYEFFTQQTSIVTAPTYGNSYAQKLDIHGYGIGDGYQNIVVTINGRRLNNIDMVSQLLAAIPVNSIERIEILKGAGSVAYGDGANAATINIITKTGNSNELSFYAGNYHTLGESLYLSASKDRYSYSVHLDHSKTDGTRVVDTNDNRDAGKNTNGGAEISYRASDDLEVHAGAQFSSYDTIYGGYLTLAQYDTNPAQKGSSKSHEIYNANVLNGGIAYTLNANYSFEIDASREVKQNNSITWGNDYRYNELSAKLNYDTDNVKTMLGINGFWGERTGLGSSDTTSKGTKAAYLSTELHIENQTFSAGGRMEEVDYTYNTAGTSLAQNNALYGAEFGYSVSLSQNQSLFAHYSHAYKAPDVDRFFTYDFGTNTYSFNGFIQPMKTNTYTIGYNNINAQNKFKAAAYYIQLKNEIYLSLTDYTNTNIDKSHKYGIDITDQWAINNQWNLYTNYNYVQSIIDHEQFNGDDYAGKKFPGVSSHNVKATISYLPNNNTTISLIQLYRSEAFALEDLNNNLAQKQQAYRSTNLSFTYAKDNYEIFARINNLFDQSNGLWIRDNVIYPVDFTTTFTAGLKFIF